MTLKFYLLQLSQIFEIYEDEGGLTVIGADASTFDEIALVEEDYRHATISCYYFFELEGTQFSLIKLECLLGFWAGGLFRQFFLSIDKHLNGSYFVLNLLCNLVFFIHLFTIFQANFDVLQVYGREIVIGAVFRSKKSKFRQAEKVRATSCQ